MYNYYGINEKLDTQLKAVAKKFSNPVDFIRDQGWQDYMEDILAYADLPTQDGEDLDELQCYAINHYLEAVWDKAQEELAEEAYTGSHSVGDIVYLKGGIYNHECRVTRTWCDETGNGISVIPTGNYGFEIDIYEDRL